MTTNPDSIDPNTTDPDPAALIDQWRRWARWANLKADQLTHTGDAFGAQLARTRGQVRHAAAQLLATTPDPHQAAKIMHHNAAKLREPEPPLIFPDHIALDYTRARTWQHCAWALDPTLPETQPPWT